MSVIAVMYQRDGQPADPGLARAMLDVARRRGPDRQEARSFGPVALGYGQLATTPEEVSSRQPRVSERTGAAIVADVRLDNRSDLLALLGAGQDPRMDDAELVLCLYEARGTEVFARLEGDFALVIWDARARRLVAARDARAQRPLYYHQTTERFLAASSILQIFQDPSVPIEPDEERIRDYLVPHNVERNEYDRPRTFFKGVLSLPAGHLLVVDRESARVSQFRDLRKLPTVRYRHAEDYVEHFRDLLFEAVRTRLRSAGPVGAFLSGGLDSTAVVATAQELYRSGLADDRGFIAYTGVFGDPECDESALAGALAAKYGFTLRTIDARYSSETLSLDPVGFLPEPRKAVHEMDRLLDAVSADDIRVALTGEGGDSCVFGAPQMFDALLRVGRLREMVRRLRVYQGRAGESWPKVLAAYCLAPFLPLWLQRPLFAALSRRAFKRSRPWLIPSWIGMEIRADLEERHLSLALRTEAARRFGSPVHHWEDTLLRPPELGFDPIRWPIELRRPYADSRLIEYLLAVPPEEKYGEVGWSDSWYAASKQLVRRALSEVLPERIKTRSEKPHFASVFQDELDARWGDYAAAFAPGKSSQIASRGYVNPTAFWERLGQVRGGTFGPDFLLLLRLITLESWFRSIRRFSSRPALSDCSSQESSDASVSSAFA